MPLRSVCPICKTVLSKIRFSDMESEYGCEKCGKWFTSSDLPQREDAPLRRPRESRLASPPGLLGLTKISIILNLKSASLTEAVQELVPKALHGTGNAFLESAKIAGALGEGIADGRCVEFHKGLAFLHLRVDELRESRAAVGVSADGLSAGGNAQGRVFVAALFLKPRLESGGDVPHWARKKFSDERTIYRLRTASDLEAVFKLLQDA
ncbi:MAG: zf-TFIIB domain-containing protein [Elusimicrobia bacterium]|nr:zf-TFIIB domain-containing protein [Elusimicrobiota bacterium]